MHKFKVGDKVIPITKSVGKSWDRWLQCTDHDSVVQFKEKGYATVVESYESECALDRYNSFLHLDLIPYTASPERAFEQLVKGHISESEYNNITRTTGSEV